MIWNSQPLQASGILYLWLIAKNKCFYAYFLFTLSKVYCLFVYITKTVFKENIGRKFGHVLMSFQACMNSYLLWNTK